MNSLYKLHAFTNVGVQQIENDIKFVGSIHCKKVKVKSKRPQSAINTTENLLNSYSNKIGCVGIAETALQNENKLKRFNKKKAFYNK